MSDSERTVTYDPLHELIARFENVKATNATGDPFADLSPEEILQKHIVAGVKKGLEGHLESALESYTPLQIINDILLEGMKTVGELFGAGKMQLPFVLQSAEVMKTAVRYLEPLMEKVEGQEKGSILLATVAGDVHDIGKNLVDIILSNNGYRVVNIGIKQPINTILEAALEHKCQVIGMSGLLVKSTLIMKENLEEMNVRGLENFPVILGGAALTRGYVEHDLREIYKGSVFYAQDAFEGLAIMGQLADQDPTTQPKPEVKQARPVTSHRVGHIDTDLYKFDGIKSDIEPMAVSPKLPFYGAQAKTDISPFEIYPYINPIALFRGQWQYRRPPEQSNLEFDNWIRDNIQPVFERWQRELADVLKPKVKWGYFPCASENNDLIIFDECGEKERQRFTFPRQRDGKRLCLSDYFRSVESEQRDTVGFSIVTVGEDVSKLERELFAKGDYQDYLYVHGMGVESAEALAEYWHLRMRHELGIADQEPEERRLLWSARYHGARYSFGYPACPNLEDQAKLFELLEPQTIGLELTEEFMLNPEQSTSAIVIHHPAAKYFNIR